MGQPVFDVFYDAVIEAVNRAKQNAAAKRKRPASSKPAPAPSAPPDEGQTPEASSVPCASETAASKSSDDEVQSPAVPNDHAQPDSNTPPKSETAEPPPQGKLILDATVAPQAIRFPTDLSLLNEAREFSERVIDELYARTTLKKKPRTYRQKARKAYLGIVKKKRPGAKVVRRDIKQQLQYLRRNLGHIERLLAHFPECKKLPLPYWLLRRYWVIPYVYAQQWEMYRNNTKRCDDRIVSISQPHVRPIVRGKVDKPTEFGAKLSVSLTGDGIARVDHVRWDAFHEGHDLPSQVEAYLPAADRRQEYVQRIPIEGKFGQGKNGYRLNYIRAKRSDTSTAWINSIFLVMNLLILLKAFYLLLKKFRAGAKYRFLNRIAMCVG